MDYQNTQITQHALKVSGVFGVLKLNTIRNKQKKGKKVAG